MELHELFGEHLWKLMATTDKMLVEVCRKKVYKKFLVKAYDWGCFFTWGEIQKKVNKYFGNVEAVVAGQKAIYSLTDRYPDLDSPFD